jgi:hypothetical protein
MESNTVIVVDCRNRSLPVFTASATHATGDGIVLRKGVDVGHLSGVVGKILPYGLLLAGSYNAMSSTGFVQILGGENFYPVRWTGGIGFGWDKRDETGEMVRRGDALRKFSKEIPGVLLPAGCRIDPMVTHSNSNPETAQAAFDGLKFLSEVDKNFIVVVEGQSDYTRAYRVTVPTDVLVGGFDMEHRMDIFSDEPEKKEAVTEG